MIGWPMIFDILSSMMRLTTSLALPPANGMITVIGLRRIVLRAGHRAAERRGERDARAEKKPLAIVMVISSSFEWELRCP